MSEKSALSKYELVIVASLTCAYDIFVLNLWLNLIVFLLNKAKLWAYYKQMPNFSRSLN